MPLPVLAPTVWALVGGAGAEAAYAWYDPDFFTQSIWSNADLDDRVGKLNNFWQNLWRSGGNRLPPSSKAGRDLDQNMAGWQDFKRRYDDAIFKRAMDPFGIWGAKADFEDELALWVKRFVDTMAEVIVADPLVQEGLAQRHVDVDMYLERADLNPDGSQKASSVGLYFGVATVAVLIGIGAVLAARR